MHGSDCLALAISMHVVSNHCCYVFLLYFVVLSITDPRALLQNNNLLLAVTETYILGYMLG